MKLIFRGSLNIAEIKCVMFQEINHLQIAIILINTMTIADSAMTDVKLA